MLETHRNKQYFFNQGETSVASATSSPVWNEEISFIEQFPPLAQRIRVQVLDDAKMGDIALATHFLDLQQISDPTRNGINPMFTFLIEWYYNKHQTPHLLRESYLSDTFLN